MANKSLDQYFEFDYWMLSLREGVEWLNENAEPESRVCLPVFHKLIQFYPFRRDMILDCNENFDYAIHVTRTALYPNNLPSEYFDATPVFSIQRYGSNLLQIKKRRVEPNTT